MDLPVVGGCNVVKNERCQVPAMHYFNSGCRQVESGACSLWFPSGSIQG